MSYYDRDGGEYPDDWEPDADYEYEVQIDAAIERHEKWRLTHRKTTPEERERKWIEKRKLCAQLPDVVAIDYVIPGYQGNQTMLAGAAVGTNDVYSLLPIPSVTVGDVVNLICGGRGNERRGNERRHPWVLHKPIKLAKAVVSAEADKALYGAIIPRNGYTPPQFLHTEEGRTMLLGGETVRHSVCRFRCPFCQMDLQINTVSLWKLIVRASKEEWEFIVYQNEHDPEKITPRNVFVDLLPVQVMMTS